MFDVAQTESRPLERIAANFRESVVQLQGSRHQRFIRAGQSAERGRARPVVAALACLPSLAPAQGMAADAAAVQSAGFALALALGALLVVMALWRIVHLWRHRPGVAGAGYHGIEHGPWPELTVFIAECHEANAVSSCIQALLNTDYPHQRVRIVPLCEQADPRTRAVIDAYAHLFPERVRPFHRGSGEPGHESALQEALSLARGDIAVVLDATYLPSPALLKQLASPFFDPEVGAVMGRVVGPQAASGLMARLLGRLLRLELLAGQPQPRQASMYLRAVPQGNAVGGVRLSAVVAVGGWSEPASWQHTDITVRLLSNGWKTVYNHRAECLRTAPAAPAGRSSAPLPGRLVTTEGPRRVHLSAERRVPPLRLRPMPTLHTGWSRGLRQALRLPPLLLALGSALLLHLGGAGLVLSAALPLAALALLSAREAGRLLARRS